MQEKDLKEFDIEKIRKVVGELQKTFLWYQNRHLEIVYDWTTYGHPKIMKLLELCKIGFEGNLKKKDKKGSWR